MNAADAVLLVGHGGLPSDLPRDWVAEQRRLEAERRARGDAVPSPRERELDRRIRDFPRTEETDPYLAGLTRVAAELRALLPAQRVELAFNEFCAPSIADALHALATSGVRRVVVLSTMITPGGGHSERDIPEALAEARTQHPELDLDYAWPFDARAVAGLFAQQASRHGAAPPPAREPR